MMKRFLPIVIFFIPFSFSLLAFAQGDLQNHLAPQDQLEEAALEIKTKARKVLTENIRLKTQQEELRQKQSELEKSLATLPREIEQTAKDITREQKILQGIEQKIQKTEKYAKDFEAKVKVLEAQAQQAKQKATFLEEQNQKLQKEVEQLQAQRQSVASYSRRAEQEKFIEETSLVVKEIETLKQKMHAVEVDSKHQGRRALHFQEMAKEIKDIPWEDKGQGSTALNNLAQKIQGRCLSCQQVSLKKEEVLFPKPKDLKRPSAQEEALETFLKKAHEFSSAQERKLKPGSVPGEGQVYQVIVKKKNDLLVAHIKAVAQKQKKLEGDLDRLRSDVKGLLQLVDQEREKNEEVKERIVHLKESKKKTLEEISRLTNENSKASSQDPAQEEILLKEQIKRTLAHNQHLSEVLRSLEEEKQKKIAETEQELAQKISTANAENRILNNQLIDLKERISKVKMENDLFESLLEHEKQRSLDMKGSASGDSLRSLQGAGTAASLWKLPEILQE